MTKQLTVVNAPSLGCLRCETFPSAITGPGMLHLRFPLNHSRGKIIAAARDSGWEYSQQGEVLSIVVSQTDLTPFIMPLCESLTATEQADVRVLFQNAGRTLELPDMFEVETLRAFAAKTQSDWLVSMLEEKRLSSWFQPIVNCAVPSEVLGYECLMRGDDNGKTVFPDRILEVARGAGLLFQLDRAARLAAISGADKFGLQTKVFINFTPTAIYDPKNCLQTTVKAVDESSLSREQIVFEVIESDEVHEPNFLRDILDFYRAEGFGVALDDIGSGYSSLNLLGRLRPDYMKLDRELISGVDGDPYKSLIAAKLLETARELGIRTVAEGVETIEEFEWLQENGADCAQGYLFAKPASPPPVPGVLPAVGAKHASPNA